MILSTFSLIFMITNESFYLGSSLFLALSLSLILSLSGSGVGWRWRQRLWVQRGVSRVIGHSRMWKARERQVHREQGPHTKGQGGAQWGREGRPSRRGHAGNQSWQHRHFLSTEGLAVSGPLGYILTYLRGAASSTLLSHSSLRELLTESRSSRNIKHTKQQWPLAHI